MRVLITGDTHGNARWLREYIFPVAMTLQAEAIVQLGDFGAWEHTPDGVAFMDQVDIMGLNAGIPLYWLHGNHDKHSHTIKAYKRDERGFLKCREFVRYIPQGHVWDWGGVSFRSFGGAYSVDKQWRVERERRTGKPGTLWFPEEEMTDAEMDQLLAADHSSKDIIVSHDKPFSSRPRWNRKNLPGCTPNQLRLERALRTHEPEYWFHGHLHHFYADLVHGDAWGTVVVGLDCDDNAAEEHWKKTQAWAVADLEDGKIDVRYGTRTFLDSERMQDAIMALD